MSIWFASIPNIPIISLWSWFFLLFMNLLPVSSQIYPQLLYILFVGLEVFSVLSNSSQFTINLSPIFLPLQTGSPAGQPASIQVRHCPSQPQHHPSCGVRSVVPPTSTATPSSSLPNPLAPSTLQTRAAATPLATTPPLRCRLWKLRLLNSYEHYCKGWP